MNIELYYYEQCPFCVRVLRKIHELGIKKITYRNILENPQYHQLHVQKTGRSTVPCLYIDGNPLFESIAINQWLSDNVDQLID
jgi:glutathione S-transferase